MATLTIDLPDELAVQARDARLFAPGAIEATLRENLRRRAADRLFSKRPTNWPGPRFPP